ncbi:coat protein [Arracacha latent virus E]|uniref:Coat protein n=2 Tax=Arracacha latent virus E TaxID=2057935 RepID=A0A3Q8CUQ2_9VIRU|nr:coat protein [Arracacha latent virus E]AUD57823.1 coat protein [Arracacha latent virus E]
MPRKSNKIQVKLAGPERNRRAVKQRAKMQLVAAVPVNPKPNPQPARRRRNRSKAGGPLGGSSAAINLKFLVDSFYGNSSGTIKFGPTLSLSEAFKGILKAFSKYRIVNLNLRYKSEASSTDRGIVMYHLDSGCKMPTSELKALTSWSLRNSGTANFGRSILGDKDWYESTEDQFWFVYKGNGEQTIAGHIEVNMRVLLTNPK